MQGGDHVWVRCTGYTHHGIATGTDSVVHYLGKKGVYEDGMIAETSLAEFTDGATVHVKDHPDRLHGRVQTVKRARQRIGETEYNLLFNNCEHFVCWCIYDEHTSEQVNSTFRTVGHAAASAWAGRSYATWVARTTGDVMVSNRTAETVRAVGAITPFVSSALTTSAAPAAATALTTSLTNTLGSAGIATALTSGGVAAAALTTGVIAAPVAVPLVVGVAVLEFIGLGLSALFD
ncbi:Lecithin retinol acyltransferase [Paraburkholderia steynii]|uniref:Lecithin retinol acyltransferase n=2 Tax=Paraburkholderia steynii TaxID=1245441 RepID=A0A7Z7B4I2_9BURK|nr:Lecithin retinol acyltransferase [Paraburkholderia steynii]